MPINLSSDAFASLFPFHVAFRRDMRVVQAGAVLTRICPEIVPGAAFGETLRIDRPVVQKADRDAILAHPGELFVLSRLSGPLRLRGQMVPLGDGETIVFLGTPWITEPGQLRDHGLTLQDFPVHDSIGDFLQVMESQVGALAELRQLTSKLNQQREALREALAVLSATLEATADGVLVADLDGRVVSRNRRFLEMWRLPDDAENIVEAGELRRLVLHQLVDSAAFSARIDWLYSKPEEQGRDLIHLLDGRIYERTSQPHRLGDKVIGRVWTYHDVTENWRANEALRVSEERYRIVAETASDGILTVDREGQILFANSAATQIFGHDREELLQLKLTDLMPENLREPHRRGVRRYTETGKRGMDWRSVHVDGLRKDGTMVPLELSFGESKVEGRLWFTGIIRDVTESRRVSQALEESEHRYRSVVDHLNEIVFQADARGRWVFLNPAWEDVTGYSVQESLGRPWYDFIHPDDKQHNFALFQPLLLREKEFCRHTVRHVTSHGETRRLEVYARLVLDDASQLTGISGTLTDVTERLDFAAHLEKARDEAEAANRAKTHFLANMSHEIRTPLNAIMGMSELMAMTNLSPEQREYQETVSTSTESLLHLINDLLDLSKIEAGQVDIDEAPFDPGEICEDAVNMLKTRILQKGLALNCWIAPALPPRVVGDRNRVRQILVNLLGNATKFTSAGGINLSLSWRILIGERVELEFEVEDTGVGIRTEDRKRIFEKFVQLDTSFSSRFSGAGLGLNISRSLAEAMGGRIELDSHPGQGSRFSLRLTLPRSGRRPVEDFLLLDRCRQVRAAVVSKSGGLCRAVAAWGLDSTAFESLDVLFQSGETFRLVVVDGPGSLATMQGTAVLRVEPPLLPGKLRQFLGRMLDVPEPGSALATPEAANTAAPRISLPRVLVVEDNVDNRKLATRILESIGCKVETAENGTEAVAKASEYIYDLILMDLRMPDMDGFEAARAIRDNERRLGIRVPIVALTAHALEDYRDQALAAGMDDYLTKPYRREQLVSLVERWVDPRPIILVADDSPEIHALVRGYLRMGGYRLVSAFSGAEAMREFHSRNISLVFLDLELGDMDGLTLARQMVAARAVPLVALTGNSGRSLRKRCLAAGCAEHLEKPVRRPVFLQTVERYAGPPAERQDFSKREGGSVAGPVLVDPLLADLIPGYLDETRRRTDDAAEKLQQGDLAGVQRTAHQLKGSGGGYGFDGITTLAAALETALLEGDAAEAANRLRLLRSYLESIRWEPGPPV